MEFHIEILTQTRKQMLDLVDGLSTEDLSKIHPELQSSIIWNFGHAMVIQQLLLYRLSGLPVQASDHLVQKYRNGSKASEELTEAELSELLAMASSSIEQVKEDFATKRFQDFQPYTTGYNIHLTSAEEALMFNNAHEALHLGVMKSIKRSLQL